MTFKLGLCIAILLMIAIAIYNRKVVLNLNKRRITRLFMTTLDKKFNAIESHKDVLDTLNFMDEQCYDEHGEFIIHKDYISEYYTMKDDLKKLELYYEEKELENIDFTKIKVVHTKSKGQEVRVGMRGKNAPEWSEPYVFDNLTDAAKHLTNMGYVSKLTTAKAGICRSISNNRNSKSYKGFIWNYIKVNHEWETQNKSI